LIVEGDSKVVINLINGDNMAQSEVGHILQDINFLCFFFSFVYFRHIKRQDNCMAHRLARRAISSPLDVWMESVPPDTINAYNFDLCFND